MTFVVSTNTPNQGTTQPTRTNSVRRSVLGHGRLIFVRRLWTTDGYTQRQRWVWANG